MYYLERNIVDGGVTETKAHKLARLFADAFESVPCLVCSGRGFFYVKKPGAAEQSLCPCGACDCSGRSMLDS